MRKLKILIVEDERIISYELEVILEHCGYDVYVTAFGEESIQLSSEIKPDLVLMDINLKCDMDGIKAAVEIHNRYKIPVIYISAYSYINSVRKAIKSESFGFVSKPFDYSELDNLITWTILNHKLGLKKCRDVNDRSKTKK